mgnify:CR=1 FL=1
MTGRDGRTRRAYDTRRRMRTRRSSSQGTPPAPAPALDGSAHDDEGAQQKPPESMSMGDLAPSEPTRSIAQALSCRPEDIHKPSRRPRGVHHGGKPGGGDPATRHHDGRHQNYMAHKIEKLGEQNDAVSAGVGVFAGVSVYVNGLTTPPWMDIKEIMLANGGKFANYYSRSVVTHIVCQHLTNAKLDALRRSDRDHPPVVTPDWVTASLDAGKTLPCAEFALEGTLEPGVRRMTSLLARMAPPPDPDPDPEVDPDEDGNQTEEEEEEDVDILPTQDDDDDDAMDDERNVTETRSLTAHTETPVTTTSGSGSVVILVEFLTVADHLAASDEDATSLAGAKVASAAAYGALAAAVDPTRIVPVGAGEALVAPETDPGSEAGDIAKAMAAAGIRARASTVTVEDVPRGGTVRVVPVRHPPRLPHDPKTPGRSGSGKSSGARLKSAMKTPGDEERHSSERKRTVRWSNAVADDIIVAGAGGERPVPSPAGFVDRHRPSPRGLMPPPPMRRSSFFAEAANLSMDRVDPDTLAAMPPDVRAELMHGTRARSGGGGLSGPNQPSLRQFMSRAGGALADAVVRGTTGESTDGGDGAGRGATKRGWDAFGSILGMRRDGGDGAGGKRARPADETVGHDGGISGDVGSDLPESYSQIDRSFLEAIGEEERARLRAHYQSVADRRRATTVPEIEPMRTHEDLLTVHIDGGDFVEPGPDAIGEDAVTPLTTDAAIDAFREALTTCVQGGDVDVGVAGDLLAAQCEAQCEAHHLESTRRLMLCGKSLADGSPGSAWSAAFESVKARVLDVVRREYDGAELSFG